MKFLSDILARAGLVVEGVVTLNNVANATIDTDKFLTVDSGVVKFRTGAQLLSDIGGQSLLTNPVTGTGTSGQVAYFNGTTSLTSSATFAFTPTSQLLVNNSVTAASAIARGTNLTPTLTASANSDVLVGLDINPTFSNGAFTGVSNVGLRTQSILVGTSIITGVTDAVQVKLSNAIVSLQNTTATNYAGVNMYDDSNTLAGSFAIGGTAASVPSLAGNFLFGARRAAGRTIIVGGASATQLATMFSTGNFLIQNSGTHTDAGFRLDVNGTARVQGVITGSVNGGSLILGTASSNSPAITITGYYVGNGAINITTTNPRSFNSVIGGQGNGIVLTYNGVAQGQGGTNTYFIASGNINLTDGAIDLNGFNFSPTIVSATGATIKAFSSGLSAATNRWNLFMSGSASNYLEGDTAIGTITLGTATKFTLGGSETASSAIARGGLINTTLVAAANNDVLVGLDINPTFTNGAFTGVQNIALRTVGSGRIDFNNLLKILPNGGAGGNAYIYTEGSSVLIIQGQLGTNIGWNNNANTTWSTTIGNGASRTAILGLFKSDNVEIGRVFNTGNVLLQNGGTFTDAGFRLDVNGTARVSGAATLSNLAGTGTRMVVADANGLLSTQAIASGAVTGTGTTNYIPKFTSSSSIGNSIIFDDGNCIGINTSSPYSASQFKLDVNGGFIVKNTSGVNAQFVMINSDPAAGGNNAFFVQTVGGATTTTWAQIQTYYGTSIAAGALRLQPAGGQILVGTTTASAFTVDLNGTLRVSSQLTLGSTITNGTFTYTLPGATGTLALTSDITTAVANLVASAPAALDTLNELAAALGNDAAFSTTVTTALGNRLRIDTASQGLTGTQQSNGRTNLGLGSLSILSSIGNANITDLAYSKLTGVPSTFPPSAHTHVWTDITDRPTNLSAFTNGPGYITSSSLSSYVPYTGATTNVNLGNNTLSVGFINILGSALGAAGYLGLRQNASIIYAGSGYTSIVAEDKTFLSIQFDQDGGTNGKFARFNAAALTNNTQRTYSLPNASGTLALTSDIPTVAGVYLPLSGGTLTGALGGTSATFSTQLVVTGSTNEQLVLSYTAASGGFTWQSFRLNGTNRYRIFGNTDNSFTLWSDVLSSNVLAIASTGAATFSSSVYAGASSRFGFGSSGAERGSIALDGGFNWSFNTNSIGNAMYIQSTTGNVVIGNTVASNVGLTIYGANAATIYQTANTGTGAGNGFYVGHTGDISYIWNYNNYPTVFATNNTERMRITSGGQVQVTNTTGDTHLGAFGTAPSIQFASATSGPAFWGTIGMATATNNFLIGAVAGDFAIINRGSVVGSILFGFSSAERMRLSSTGQLRLNAYTSSSAFTGTAVATLAVDSSGNVITVTGGGTASQWTTSGSNIHYNTGNVGIGTSSPAAKLDVNGNVIFRGSSLDSPSLTFRGSAFDMVVMGDRTSGTTDIGYVRILNQGTAVIDLPGNADPVYFNNGGNVGINTTSPSEKLHVNGNAYISGVGSVLYFDTDSSSKTISQYVTNLYEFHILNGRGNSSRFILGNGSISLGTSATPQFYINTSSGNVGIGTTTTIYGKLSVSSGSFNGIRIDTNAGYDAISIGGTGAFSVDAPGIAGGRFYIGNGGNTGIGINNPQYKLHVYTSDNEGIYLQGTGGGIWMNVKSAAGKMWSYGAQNDGCGIYNRTDGVYRMFITDSGATTFSSSVTAGGNFTTTADGGAGGLRLTLNNTGAGEVQYALLSGGSAGTGVFGIRNGSTGTNLFLMNSTGAATFTSSITCTSLTETSTIKVKENIVNVDSALDQVEKLQAVSYNRKGSAVKEIGLIAEAVEEIYPEFVQYDQHGEPIGLHYSRLTAVLIESVKELKNRIQQLENRN